jgi:uncharacterized protein YndB with AHSA1/START domain
MTTPARSTHIKRHINAPPARVYQALLDPIAIAKWKVPGGMTCEVHEFEPREGGTFRVSLTYDAPTGTGKTTPHTDTYHGYFERLVPELLVVEVTEFESDDTGLRGAMRAVWTLTPSGAGTDVAAVHENVPPGVSLDDNEEGWRQAVEKLAAWVE